ncbi:MAG: hypothetical protein ACEPOW_04875 [Bacteroidales bacterium]
MKWYFKAVILLMVVGVCSCKKKDEIVNPQNTSSTEGYTKRAIDLDNDLYELIIPNQDLIAYTNAHYNDHKNTKGFKWNEATHNSYAYICALKLGLSEDRATKIGKAAEMPDYLQDGLEHGYEQLYSHQYMYLKSGLHIWGGADDHCYGNIMGADENGKTIGYKDKWAGYYYDKGDQEMGDWYLGYGLHFITDVCEVMHSTWFGSKLNMVIPPEHHYSFEKWVENNWTEGFCFSEDVKNVNKVEFYYIRDVKKAVQKAALNSSYYHSDFGRKAWDAFAENGYKTGVGEGDPVAVENVRKMVREATMWTGGMMRYALDHYHQY